MPSKRKSRTHIFQRYRTRTSKRSCSQPKSKAEQDTEEVEALPPEEDEQIENSNSEGETETAKDNEEDSDQQVIQKKTARENKKSDKHDNKVLEDNVQLSDDGGDVHTEGEKDTIDNLYKKASRRAHRYKSYSHEMLVAAYKCVKDLKMPVKAAARMFGVPSSTLHNRVQGQVQIDDSILTSEEVVKITEKLKNGEGLDDAFAGLTYEKSSGDLGRCFTSTVEDEDINDESLTESILQQMKYSAMTNDTQTVKEEVVDPEYEHQINQSDTENDNQNNGSTCSSSETFITPEQRDFRLRPDYEKLRRSYKRNYKTYSYEQLVAAYLYVKEKKVAVKFAARAFGVPPSTLNDRVQGKVFIDTSIVMNSPGGRKYLPKPDLVRAAISSKTNDSQLSSIISSDDSAPPTPDISDSTSNDVPSITKQIYNSMEGRPEFQNIFKKHKCRDQYRKYTQEQLMEACKYAIETRASYREVSEKFGIPQSTLRDKLHAVEKLNNDGQPPTKKARVDTPQITEPESTVVLCPEIPDNDLSRGSNGTNDRSNYRQYSKDSLMTAAHYVMKFNTPIMKAARMFGVPASTLKDHVKNKMTGSQETVAPPTTPSLISDRDERKLIEYIKMMEKCGFILTQREIIDFGSELASTSREIDGSITLSDSWYLDFVKRWPPLGLVNRERRNSTPQDTKKYFTELNKVFNKHKFFERPELVYVLEEVDIALECNPLKLVPRKRFQKSKGTQQTLTSIIGCSNALGTSLPPYYVLQSDEVVADVISQCPPGTQATFANSASKDCSIVRDYFQNHFMRFAQSGRNTQNRFVLVFYDSRKSNFNVSDLEWAKRWHILLHPLPHPVNKDNEETMDGIFQNYCTDVEEARLKFVDEKGYMAVSMPDICGILGKAYRRSLTYEQIVSCFENFGIYPLNPQKYVAQLEPSFQVKLQDLHAVANYETNLWLLSDFGCTQAVNNVIESSLNSSYTSDSNNQNSFYQNENSSKYIGQMNKSDMINPSGSRYNQETASFNTSGLVNQLLEQCVGINPQEPLMNGMAIKTEPQMDLSYGQITGESQNQNHFNYQLSESYMTDQSRSVNTPNILSVPQFPRIQTVQTSDMSSTENTSLTLSSQTGLDESQEQPFISSQITPNSKTKHESSSSSRRKGKSHRVIVNEPNNENSATPAAESSNPSTADNSTPSTESNIIFCKSKVDNNRKASKLGSLLDEKVRKLHEQAKASNESIDDTDEPLMKVGEFQIVMNKGD